MASLETLEMPTPKKKGKGKGKAGPPTRGGRTPVSMPTRTTTRGAKGKKVGGGAVGGKKKKKKAEAPPPPDPEKVAAAIAVQRAYRGHLVLKRAAEARAAEKRRREQQEELDRLEQEAYVEMMKVRPQPLVHTLQFVALLDVPHGPAHEDIIYYIIYILRSIYAYINTMVTPFFPGQPSSRSEANGKGG